jgi:hypothetical protein
LTLVKLRVVPGENMQISASRKHAHGVKGVVARLSAASAFRLPQYHRLLNDLARRAPLFERLRDLNCDYAAEMGSLR